MCYPAQVLHPNITEEGKVALEEMSVSVELAPINQFQNLSSTVSDHSQTFSLREDCNKAAFCCAVADILLKPNPFYLFSRSFQLI